jgi:hypothetical protein
MTMDIDISVCYYLSSTAKMARSDEMNGTDLQGQKQPKADVLMGMVSLRMGIERVDDVIWQIA